MSVASMFTPPEQAGCLLKKGHSRGAWKERYFVLKAKRLHGVIPLESAKIETELPPPMAGAAKGGKGSGSFFITITLHSSHAFSCRHPFFLLSAPTQEVQQAWINALWQAAIPRADLIQHLSSAGRLADVLAGYATNVKDNFPVADATVLSSGGRARTGALDNVGSLAGMIRRHKTAAAVKDIDQLPVVMSGRPAATNVLARTTSGNLVTAPSTSVVPADSFTTRPSLNGGSSSGGSSGPAGGASSAAASSAKPADKPATPSAAAAAAAVPASSSTASKPQPQGMVAVSAAAGTGAAAAAATTAKSPASPVAAAKVEEVKAIQALPSSSDIGSGKGKR